MYNNYIDIVKMSYFDFLETTAYYTKAEALNASSRKPYSIIIQHETETKTRYFLVYDNQYDFDNLINIKTNNYLHEYYPEEKASYFYLDIDKKGSYNKFEVSVILNTILSSVFKESIKLLNRTFNPYDCSVWTATRPDKLSLHITIPLPFQNKADLNVFGKHLHSIHPDLIDLNLYNRTAQLRMPYQSKRDAEKFPLLPYQCPHKLQVFKQQIFNLIDDPDDIIFCQVKQKKVTIKQQLNTELVATPNYETNDEIKFYLSCIPNNGNGQPTKIWLMVGMILHKYNQPLFMWVDWSNQCSLYGDQSAICSKYYQSFKPTEKGYTIGSLIRTARQYVPKSDIWFNKLFNQLTSLKTDGFSYVEYNEPYVRDYPSNFDIVIERSPMGTGKTSSIKRLLDLYDNPKRCLYLSPRIIFSHNIEGEFKNYGFINYKTQGFNPSSDRVICSIESIHRLQGQIYDLIIMDESETVLCAFNSPTLKKIKPCIDAFEFIFKNSRKIIAMDAMMSNRTRDFFNNLMPDRSKQIRVNTFSPVKRTAYMLPSGKALISKIKEKLQKGFRCVVASASNGFCHKVIEDLHDIIQEKKVKFYEAKTGDTIKHECIDARTAWKDLDLLLYTPTITVGVNFDLPDMFDYLFIYGSDLTTSVRDMFQSSMRVRHIKTNTMFYTYHKSYDHDGFLSTDKISETLSQRLDFNQEAKPIPWLHDVIISCQFERHISGHFYDKLFERYLKELNYTSKIIEKVKAYDNTVGDKGGYLDLAKEYTDKDITQAEQAVKISNATEEQKNIYANRFMNLLINTSLLNTDQKRDFFNNVINKPVVMEKFQRLSRCLNGKMPDKLADNVTEVLNDYSSIYPQINQLVSLMNCKNLIDFDTVISLDKKDEINKTLDIIFKDMQITDTHKKRNAQSKTTQTEDVKIINRINMALYRWSDSELVKVGEKKVTVNSKRVMVREYKLKSNLPLPTIKDKTLNDLLIRSPSEELKTDPSGWVHVRAAHKNHIQRLDKYRYKGTFSCVLSEMMIKFQDKGNYKKVLKMRWGKNKDALLFMKNEWEKYKEFMHKDWYEDITYQLIMVRRHD